VLNVYRRLLLYAAATQALLHALLAGARIKVSQSINWTPALSQAFEKCKTSLSHAAMLAHPDGAAPIALVKTSRPLPWAQCCNNGLKRLGSLQHSS